MTRTSIVIIFITCNQKLSNYHQQFSLAVSRHNRKAEQAAKGLVASVAGVEAVKSVQSALHAVLL
jgi:hypothetical protein